MQRLIDLCRAAPWGDLTAALLSLPLIVVAASSSQGAQSWSATGFLGRSVPAAYTSAAVIEAAANAIDIVVPLPPYPPPISGLEGLGRPKPFQTSALAAARIAESAARLAARQAAALAAPPPLPASARLPIAAPVGPSLAKRLAKLSVEAISTELASRVAALKSSRPSAAEPMAVGVASLSAPPVPPPLPPGSAPAPTAPPAVSSPPPSQPAPYASPPEIAAPELPPIAPASIVEDHTPEIMRAAFLKAQASALYPRLSKVERDGLAAYYDKRAFKPLWHVDGLPTAAAAAIRDRLAHAADDGLDPDDYAGAGTPVASTRPEDIAEAEWRLSAASLAYARDARGARVNPTRLSTLITPDLTLPDAQTVLDALTRANDAGIVLHSFNPQAAGYVNLRTALARLRAQMVAPASSKAEPTPGTQLASVTGEPAKGGRRAPIAVPFAPKRVEADIIANMERWRWLPAQLGERYIIVNVPEFKLRYVNNGVLTHEARVIVGKPTSPTPLFSGEMKFIVVNPTWYIPPSILKKEFLPKLAEDPLYAERQGYVVAYNGGQISIRQPPGERNALGRIKFMFPNKHSVYLHDTPTRSLFASAERAFSHGCVRVDQPFKLAEYVLNDAKIWPERRIARMVGGGERTISLPSEIPVHIAYFTLAADDDGTLHRVGDIYGLDPRLEAMLLARR
jgi:L,D-transpeptidase YcbB